MLKQYITREQLIEKIGEHNIFEYYFGPFELGKSYNSVLRDDVHKSTGFFFSDNNTLLYNDFARSKRYDFVGFVMKKFGLKYREAMEQIAADFGLINGKQSNGKVAIIKPHKQPVKPQQKQITVFKQAFKKQHLDYWQEYGITEDELIQNNVLAIKKFEINGYKIPISNELRFAYLINTTDNLTGEDTSYVKIYTPYSLEYKWITNAPLDVMFGFNELPYISNTLFLCKAQKERLICLKFAKDVVSLQSENKGSIDSSIMEYLKKRYKRIIYFGDNDKPGLRFCKYLHETYNIETYHFPESWQEQFEIKDLADFVKKWGVEMFKTYLKMNLK